MADFSLSPNPMIQQPSVVDAFTRGVGIMQTMQNNNLRQQIGQQQLEQQQKQNEALNQYGQTGNPMELRGVDPMLSAKLTDWYKNQPPENLQDINKATAYIEKIAPILNSQSWPIIRPKILEAYPNLPQEAVPPEEATDQHLFQWANAGKMLNATIKSMEKGPKVAGGKVFYQGQWIDPGLSEAKKTELGIKNRGVDVRENYYQGKLDIDRNKAEQDKFTGNVGTAFKILKRRLGRDPSDDELEEFNNRFQNDLVKTKNPGVLAIESAKNDWEYQSLPPDQKKGYLDQRTKDFKELIDAYGRGTKKGQISPKESGPSAADLQSYKRALEANANKPDVIEKIKAKAKTQYPTYNWGQ